ncbi:FapA family protein [Paenibacillus oenotherae]|uniref:FapA family protein n=1 Tax=Paenibacillus oenotherae TaxID=1435645 RepID=A0ABS7D0B2_9BACL|nr:FapA family protein [Paenibacillus oenotherae]MBW7473272.1 FapA family protein [Paenibacillus oenotherae]
MSTYETLETYIVIQISPDKLTAHLRFNVADENLTITSKQLEEFVRSHGVIHGIDLNVLANIARQPKLYFNSQTLVAQGEMAVNGEDGAIRFSYDMKEEQHKPVEIEGGKVDFKEITQLKNVRRGQLIAEKVPATEGKPGKAVTGDDIAGKNGKEAYFKLGKNVVLNPEQTALYAAIDGLITMTDKNKINVFPIYEVNGDVDYNIGNIDFVGTVVVRGNVLTGFRIKASGDIRVIGGVEGAELESEGSIEITGGILASNKGYVKAGKNVKSSFIQDGNVTAMEDVLVTQSIMHSHVRAGRNVVCSGTKGLVVGGMIQAGERVVARTIGNTMSTATAIEVGVRPELRSELLELRQHLKSTGENLDKTEKALTLLDQLAAAGQLPSDKLALRIKLGATKRQAVEEMSVSRERILEIEKSLEDTDTARVDVINTIYGGTKIVIGRYTRFVKDPTQRISFRYSEGDIVMAPYL